MPITIKDLRLAWIWLEGFAATFSSPLQDLLAKCSLGETLDYQAAFRKAALQPATGPFTVPWDMTKPERIQYFWTYYFENVSPHRVRAEDAWRKLVPLRRLAGVTAELPGLTGKLRFSAFHFPHALGLVASAGLQGDFSLDGAVDKVQQVGRGAVLNVSFADGGTGNYTLPSLAAHTLDLMRSNVFGPDVPAGERSQPFTLATVVRAEGAMDVNSANPENGELHHALDGLCRGHGDWRNTPPVAFKESVIATRRAPTSHLLYGLKRGRAVWYPASFLPNPRRRFTLGCYHHNLLFASLQTESLLALLGMADRTGDLNRLSQSMQRLVRSAAGIVGRLYGGDQSCYRSRSPRRQIDDSSQVDGVNRVRLFYGMGPLKT
jgi:hypothetical protein